MFIREFDIWWKKRNHKTARNCSPNVGEGFSYQKTIIIGFGPLANFDTEMVMKILTTGKITLNKVPYFLYRCIAFKRKKPWRDQQRVDVTR